MGTPQAALSRGRTNLALATRFLGTFVLGSAELLAVAVLLTRRDDGSWLDVILWRTRAEAETAADHVNDFPEAAAWFPHVAASRGLQHLDVVDHRMFAATLDGVPSIGRSTATPVDCTLQVQPRGMYR